MELNEEDAPALQGLRIVELAEGISGPYCGKLLADLGAEVTKIEQPRIGDFCRGVGPFAGDQPSAESGLLFNFLNTNKRGISLDPSFSFGRELLLALIERADVFVYGGPPAGIDTLGLDVATLTAANRLLVVTFVTPFGLDGPYRDRTASELVSLHMSGLGILMADQVRMPPPHKAGGNQAQLVAGLTAAIATMEALFAREANGEAQVVDVSHLEPIASFQFMNVARWVYMGDPGQRGFTEGSRKIFCRDGAVLMAIGQDHQWRAFQELMGRPDWAKAPEFETQAGRRQNAGELWAQVQGWAADLEKAELCRLVQSRHIPAFPENSIAEAVDSEQIRQRGFIQELPLASGGTAAAPIAPYVFSETPVRCGRPAPRLGQHNREVFCGELGLSNEELGRAFEAGVV